MVCHKAKRHPGRPWVMRLSLQLAQFASVSFLFLFSASVHPVDGARPPNAQDGDYTVALNAACFEDGWVSCAPFFAAIMAWRDRKVLVDTSPGAPPAGAPPSFSVGWDLKSNDGNPGVGVSNSVQNWMERVVPVNAQVGLSWSSVTMASAQLAHHTKHLMMGYSATNAKLSNKKEYGYFMRTCPPDSLQSAALLALVAKFNANKLIWLYVDEPYAAGIYNYFRDNSPPELQLYSEALVNQPSSFEASQWTPACRRVMQREERYVVVAVAGGPAVQMWETLLAAGALTPDRQFFGAEGAVANSRMNFSDVLGAIGVRPLNKAPLWSTWLSTYYTTLTMDKFPEFFGTAATPADRLPLTQDRLTQGYSTFYDPFLVDSVFSVLFAAERLVHSGVPVAQVRGEVLRNEVYKSSFPGVSGFVAFDVNGDRAAAFEVWNVVRVAGVAQVVVAGLWSDAGLTVGGWEGAPGDSAYPNLLFTGEVTAPLAVVLQGCPRGQKYMGLEAGCQLCASGSYSLEDQNVSPNCRSCEPGYFAADAGMAACKPCLQGTFQDIAGQDSCRACPAGNFTSAVGANSCERCMPGSFSEGSATQCTPCPVRTYQDDLGQPSCKPCKVGFTTEYPGALDIALCVCPPDTFLTNGECRSCKGDAKLQGLTCPGGVSCKSSLDTNYTTHMQCPHKCIAGEVTCRTMCMVWRHEAEALCEHLNYTDTCMGVAYPVESGPVADELWKSYGSNLSMRAVAFLQKGTKQSAPGWEATPHRRFCNPSSEQVNSMPLVEPGYWTGTDKPFDTYLCRPADRCPGGLPGTCNYGRSPDWLCALCPMDTFEYESWCMPCEQSSVAGAVIVCCLLPIACFIAFLVLSPDKTHYTHVRRSSRVEVDDRSHKATARHSVLDAAEGDRLDKKWVQERQLEDLTLEAGRGGFAHRLAEFAQIAALFSAESVDTLKDSLATLLEFVQVMALVFTVDPNLGLLDVLRQLEIAVDMSLLDFQLIAASFGLNVGCLFGQTGAVQFLLNLMIPTSIFLAFIFNWAVFRLLRPVVFRVRSRVGQRGVLGRMATVNVSGDRTINAAGGLISTFFVGLTNTALSFFVTYEHPDPKNRGASLRKFPSLLFGSQEWTELLPFCLLGVFVYVVLVLGVVSYVVVTAPRKVHDAGFRVRWHFLFDGYRPSKWWWGLFLMVKAALLNMATIFFSGNVQQVIIAGIVVLSLSCVFVFKPWPTGAQNIIDTCCHVALVILLMCTTVRLGQMNVLVVDPVVQGVEICAILGPVVVTLLMMGVPIYTFVRRRQNAVHRFYVGQNFRDLMLLVVRRSNKELARFMQTLDDTDIQTVEQTTGLVLARMCGMQQSAALGKQRLIPHAAMGYHVATDADVLTLVEDDAATMPTGLEGLEERDFVQWFLEHMVVAHAKYRNSSELAVDGKPMMHVADFLTAHTQMRATNTHSRFNLSAKKSTAYEEKRLQRKDFGATLEQIFRMLQTGCGEAHGSRLSRDGFVQGATRLMPFVTPRDANRCFKILDVDRTGVLTLTDFETIFTGMAYNPVGQLHSGARTLVTRIVYRNRVPEYRSRVAKVLHAVIAIQRRMRAFTVSKENSTASSHGPQEVLDNTSNAKGQIIPHGVSLDDGSVFSSTELRVNAQKDNIQESALRAEDVVLPAWMAMPDFADDMLEMSDSILEACRQGLDTPGADGRLDPA